MPHSRCCFLRAEGCFRRGLLFRLGPSCNTYSGRPIVGGLESRAGEEPREEELWWMGVGVGEGWRPVGSWPSPCLKWDAQMSGKARYVQRMEFVGAILPAMGYMRDELSLRRWTWRHCRAGGRPPARTRLVLNSRAERSTVTVFIRLGPQLRGPGGVLDARGRSLAGRSPRFPRILQRPPAALLPSRTPPPPPPPPARVVIPSLGACFLRLRCSRPWPPKIPPVPYGSVG